MATLCATSMLLGCEAPATKEGDTKSPGYRASVATHRAAITLGQGAIVDNPACFTNALQPCDDCSSGAISLPMTINFFGGHYNTVYLNNNGNITFDGGHYNYTPFDLSTTTYPIIAPFFADVWTLNDPLAADPSNPKTVTWGSYTENGHAVWCATFDGVGSSGVGYYYQGYDRRDAFQVLLIDRADRQAGDFDIVFNYDRIEWESGDASGGVGGLAGPYGYSARAGYAAHNPSDPTSFYELWGSGIAGSFLDPNGSGLIHNSADPVGNVLGRYRYQVLNAAPLGTGSISGRVIDSSNQPVAGAMFDVCPESGATPCVWQGNTDATGNYSATGLGDGTYVVRAFPPSASNALPAASHNNTITGGAALTGVNLQLMGPHGPPAGTTVSPANSGSGGVPSVYYRNPITFTTSGCTGGTATYTVASGANTLSQGPMTESPAGTYTAQAPAFYPNHGNATVTLSITCPGGAVTQTVFDIYIDPSGTVKTLGGRPISGATVTIYRFQNNAWTVIPNGSAVMSPSNRQNPMTSDALGRFGWDVIAGFYKVRATAPGCQSGDRAQRDRSYVETTPLRIPPAVFNVDLRMDCGPESAVPPTVTVPAPITREATGPSGAAVTFAVSATDPVDGPLAVTCVPASGSTFALGTATVNCSATNHFGLVGRASFAVTVQDTTPPALTLPANRTMEATALNSVVTFSATAVDLVDGSTAVTCTPASGAALPLGLNTVSCASSDRRGNRATGSFTIRIVDTTPPTLTISVTPNSLWPPNHRMVAIATTKTASDLVDAHPTVTCGATSNEPADPGETDIVIDASGNISVRSERLGTGSGRIYTISCTARDFSGNVSRPVLATVTVPHDEGH